MDWLPIETAPKDGTEILLYRGDGGVLLGRWIAPDAFLTESELSALVLGGVDTDEEDWFGADFVSGYRFDEPPTHWMPLPAPPQEVRNE